MEPTHGFAIREFFHKGYQRPLTPENRPDWEMTSVPSDAFKVLEQYVELMNLEKSDFIVTLSHSRSKRGTRCSVVLEPVLYAKYPPLTGSLASIEVLDGQLANQIEVAGVGVDRVAWYKIPLGRFLSALSIEDLPRGIGPKIFTRAIQSVLGWDSVESAPPADE